MLQVVQAYDRAPIAEVPTDDGASLRTKLEAASRGTWDRGGWLKPHERIAILRRLAALVEGRRDHFGPADRPRGGKSVARRGGGSDLGGGWHYERRRRTAELRRARDPDGPDGRRNDRWAFTTKEPISVGRRFRRSITR